MDWKQRIFNIELNASHKVITILGVKIKRRLSEEIYVGNLLKTQIVRDSGLFDAKYYIAKYHPDFDIAEAVYYYTQKGYKFLEQPSEIFEVNRYKRKYEINQILDFVLCGRYNYTKAWWSNKFPADEQDINNYIEEKAKRVSKKVVYMCITNNFDSLEEISAHKYINPEWDYICFTDNEEHIKQKRVGIWEIRPLFKTEKSPAKTNRWHKIHPHILFPEYEESIYIDANVNVLTDKLFVAIKAKNKNILFPKHANNVDLYKEIQWANKVGYDTDECANYLTEKFQKEGFPRHYGMSENNIIYRKHHLPEIIEMMDEWWYFMDNHSNRDQTTFAYILWKHNMQIEDYSFENTRIDYKNFCVFVHPDERN